jgi:hypothetical protein
MIVVRKLDEHSSRIPHPILLHGCRSFVLMDTSRNRNQPEERLKTFPAA